MTIINLVLLSKFFYIICKALFVFLSAVSKIKERLLGPISNYFIKIEINRHRMFHLNCLVWLKEALHLTILCSQI